MIFKLPTDPNHCLFMAWRSLKHMDQKWDRTGPQFLASPSGPYSFHENQGINSCVLLTASLSLYKSFVKATIVLLGIFRESCLAMAKLQNGWSHLCCVFLAGKKSHESFLLGYSFTRASDVFVAALPSRLDRASIFLVSGVSSTILSLFRRKSWREEARSQISLQKSLEIWGPSYLLMLLFSQLSTPHSPCVSCCSFFKKFIFSLSKI